MSKIARKMLAFVDGVQSKNRVEMPAQRKKSASMSHEHGYDHRRVFYEPRDDNSEKLS